MGQTPVQPGLNVGGNVRYQYGMVDFYNNKLLSTDFLHPVEIANARRKIFARSGDYPT